MKHTNRSQIRSFSKVRYSPEIRSAYIERFEDGPSVLTLFGKSHYLDESLLANSKKVYIQMSIARVCIFLLRSAPSHVEVPEPLWTRKMLHTLLLLVCAHVGAALRFRECITSTYCIENEDAARIARLPDAVHISLRIAALRIPLRVFALLIRRWVFGTDASRLTYEAILGAYWPRMAERSSVLWPLPSACSCPESSKPSKKVLFLGALTTRKGVSELLTAWEHFAPTEPGAHLSIFGTGELSSTVAEWVQGRSDATWQSRPARSAIHAELREADIVVLLSRPEKYWKEQIGLPLLEGLAHGCRLITTGQTGIASWLSSNGHYVVENAEDSAHVATALRSALKAGPWPTDQLPTVNGRAAAAALMFE